MARSKTDGQTKKTQTMADPSVFGKISRLIVSDTPLDTILQSVIEQAVICTGANRGFLAIADNERGELVVRYTAGDGWDDEKRKLRLKVSEETGRGITSHVGATGWPHRTGNVTGDPYYIQFFDDAQSEMAVPLLDADHRTRGVINVDSSMHEAFDDEHEQILSSIANMAVASIVMADHRARERAVISIGKDLTQFSETPLLLQKIIDVTAEALRFEDCSLFLIDQSTGDLVLRATRGNLGEQMGKAVYRLGEGLTGWVAREGLPIRTQAPHSDPRWRGLHQEFPPHDIGAFMAVPVYGLERVLGVLRVLRKKSPYPWFPNDFTQDEETVLSIIAGEVGVALENGRLIDRLVKAERMAAWGDMSARSAHMIGNRVFAIKGDLNELKYVLEQAGINEESINELMTSIDKGIFGLEEILNEFREFVMATRLTQEEIDLNELVSQTARETFPKRSKVTLNMELAQGLPRIIADSSRLKRCFGELIENAINWIGDAGQLTIRTETADLKKLRNLPKMPRSGSYIQITVEDTGPGVPDENKSKIFTPFVTSRSKGMGLGLSIVKGVIEAHRGVIQEIGTPGKGARFLILLPYLSSEHLSAEGRGQEDQGHGGQ